MVARLIFKSLHHFELIFVFGVKELSNFVDLPVLSSLVFFFFQRKGISDMLNSVSMQQNEITFYSFSSCSRQ